MKRTNDGYDENDLLRYCGNLLKQEPAGQPANVPDPNHADFLRREAWARRAFGGWGFLGPMTTEALVEGLISAEGEGAFSYVDRLDPAEIRRRHLRRERSGNPLRPRNSILVD
jgi:hypothetical protein